MSAIDARSGGRGPSRGADPDPDRDPDRDPDPDPDADADRGRGPARDRKSGRSGPRGARALATVLLALSVAACGAPASVRGDAARAAEGFGAALAAGDLPSACALLAPGTREELEDTARQACAQALGEEDLTPGGPVHGTEVFGRQARVLMEDDTVFLSRFDGGWKVVAAGCRPVPDLPYRCTLKGA
ncbi:hypothetical protein [Streptomyces antimicrobicus]|uniref:Lipoprotein n=1 Tax=Streptomyces antimicrobicus TaxID=2883108 RepID=A0ABS8B3K7_9ACTN|nr:hypothetical protein [Streptomyces antimicrobicus]MCB5179194.1 hypothetical protein [Streptomyces antimicrobicus]